ncbi:MAG: DUF512 domain-containing protein [Clostridiales bacterium]|nr:DUF512 domain-containing protein [Eubacteriales bacterium]MDH7566678.1 DUF512 domain-containing protein [Clostridiales bacterium]
MSRNTVSVYSVSAGSIAQEAGIEQGDVLLSINGAGIRDIFDYRFLITGENIVVKVQKPSGEIWEVDIEKDEYEDLGIEFRNSMIDETKSCRNKCIFCFIDQLPKGLRKTLYFKDDDSRLSFLTGSYITLTNVSDEDIDRIIRYRMAPINISVHTTNPGLRKYMLKNRHAGNVMDRIKKLVDGGITVNCQIVLCRNVNDGRELDRTLSDLVKLYPGMKSISVVPVGITKYREGLCELAPYDKESSAEVVKQVEGWQRKMFQTLKSRIVYIADEFYIMAGIEIPDYEVYEDFPQIENGVGLIASLRDEFNESLKSLPGGRLAQERHISIATGVLAYRYIKEMCEAVEKKYRGLTISVYKIKNDFFGENITVTGLLTGRDIMSQLSGVDLGTELLICRSMLKAGEELLLDDFTVAMLEGGLDVKITVVENNGKDFVDKVLGAP